MHSGLKNTGLLIGGQRVDGADGERIVVVNPANGEPITNVAAGTAADASRAVDVAAAAQKSWAATAPRVRSEILRAAWQSMIDHADELAALIVQEHGKPMADAKTEVAYAAEFFRWNAEETVRLQGSIGTAPSGDKKMIVHHPPMGVVVMVTPWNFPAAMITRKLAPALGAGNAVVIKPARETPLSALRIGELLEDVGLPPGLVNIVASTDSRGWFDAAIDNTHTRMVSFTGSTEVGRVLLRRCADRVLKTVMELGGNAPFIVFNDADLESAVEGAMTAKMRHSAETCTAANRFYVESGIAADFTAALAEAMSAVKVGDGFDESVTCGPMINARAIEDIEGLVQGAVAAGANTVVGGGRIDAPGFFYQPTVLSGVEHSFAIAREEIFGPVAPVIPFEDSEAMISAVNDTEMGLTGYVYTGDLARGLRVSERIQAGMIGLNRGAVSDPAAPFGGMKQSGLGREGASEGIYEFCETQYIATNW